ncbi:acyl carrier protein [Streptomyces aureoversilis]|uniref:Acyl carrier protein n=1 Tax=Streptomyces aureoversilis TaxID=67277 RepID=A0ABW0A2I7_9ACTN
MDRNVDGNADRNADRSVDRDLDLDRDRDVDRNEVFARLVEMVSAEDGSIDVSRIRLDETPFHAYGLTSLTQLRVGARVAELFGIPFRDSDALLALSPLGLVTLVERRLAGAA